MPDQDLQRLFDYLGAPSHAFHAIKRREAIADLLNLWPVLDEANGRILEVLEKVTKAPPVALSEAAE